MNHVGSKQDQWLWCARWLRFMRLRWAAHRDEQVFASCARSARRPAPRTDPRFA